MKTIIAVLIICAFASCSVGQTQLSTIQLPQPRLDRGIPVMQALAKRQSTRTVSDAALTLQQMSEILWAADGVNRPDNEHRTAPSAIAQYPVDIYAVTDKGVYLYDPLKHNLTPVTEGDNRKATGSQDFVAIAPLNLVYVVDLDRLKSRAGTMAEDLKIRWAAVEAGAMVQNVYLYCASEGLGAVIRGSIDGDGFLKVIKGRPSQRVICAQTVGKPK